MSQVDNIFEGMTEEEIAAYSTEAVSEGHIVVGADRFVTVPESLKRIAVQYDHDIETVTFDCPRYWDGIDLSVMAIYINYMLSNGYVDSYPVNNVRVDDEDDKIMHFDWTISSNVTQVSGSISFIVCIKNINEDGNEINHWNSELNTELRVSKGMECVETPLAKYPDLVTQLLLRVDTMESRCNDILNTAESSASSAAASASIAVELAAQIDDALMVGRKDTEYGGEIFNTYAGDNKNHAVDGSVAYGEGTAAMSPGQYVAGAHNIVDDENKYAYIVGNGTPEEPSNAMTVGKNGISWYKNGMVIGGVDENDTTAPFYVKDGVVHFYGKEVTFGGEH